MVLKPMSVSMTSVSSEKTEKLQGKECPPPADPDARSLQDRLTSTVCSKQVVPRLVVSWAGKMAENILVLI